MWRLPHRSVPCCIFSGLRCSVDRSIQADQRIGALLAAAPGAMEAARAFADGWVAAWHSRDIDAILSHYSDDIQFYSPRVKARYEASGVGDAGGVLTGKEELSAYFQEALDKLKVIRMIVQDVMLGLHSSFAITYTRETGAKVVEVFELDQHGKAAVVRVYYDAVC